MWDLIVLIPHRCLSIYFLYFWRTFEYGMHQEEALPGGRGVSAPLLIENNAQISPRSLKISPR